MKRLAVTVAVLATFLAFAPAGAAPVMHLAWDDCGASGTTLKQFTCNTNVGAQRLVLSFVPPEGITNFSGVEAVVRIVPSSDATPAWWLLSSTGCRTASVTGSVSLEGVVDDACLSPYGPIRGGGAFAGDATTLKFAGAQNAPGPLDPAFEYFAGAITINRAKTVGNASCAGCDVPLALFLESMKLTLQDTPSIELSTLRGTGYIPFVSWQCGAQVIAYEDFRFGWSIDHWEFPGCSTPAKRTTWGTVKSLYR